MINTTRIASPMHPSQGGRGGGGNRGRGRGRGNIGRDRDLIGQTIKITQGPYKSHIGIVKVSKGEKIYFPKKYILIEKFYCSSDSKIRYFLGCYRNNCKS